MHSLSTNFDDAAKCIDNISNKRNTYTNPKRELQKVTYRRIFHNVLDSMSLLICSNAIYIDLYRFRIRTSHTLEKKLVMSQKCIKYSFGNSSKFMKKNAKYYL